MEDVYLGIDIGLRNTGYAFLQRSTIYSHYNKDGYLLINCGLIQTKKDDLALKKIYLTWKDLLKTYNPKIAFLERAFININSKTSMELIKGQAITSLSLEMNNCQIIEIQSTTARKLILNNGHATKQDGIKYIMEEFGIETCEHIADAIIVALAGLK